MNTAILGTGSYLPETILTSAELAGRLSIDEKWILDKTGIKERRVANQDQVTSDLAVHAADRALKAAGIGAKDVDLLILATSTPDQPVPATACYVQEKLGASGAAAFDVSAGCTGFLHAISIANSLILSNDGYHVALVIGAALYSRFLNYADKRSCVLFGDGAGALVLGYSLDEQGILGCRLASDGSYAEMAQIAAGGSRLPASHDTIHNGSHYVAIKGGDIRRLVAKLLPTLVSDVARASGTEISAVDLVVPHQPNGRMLDEWANIIGIEPNLMHRTIDWCGNTGAASIPITLDDAIRIGRVKHGSVVMLLGIGAGVTWGGLILRWLTSVTSAQRKLGSS